MACRAPGGRVAPSRLCRNGPRVNGLAAGRRRGCIKTVAPADYDWALAHDLRGLTTRQYARLVGELVVGSAQDMFPGISTEDIGVWPADDGELVVSIRGGGAVPSN